MGKFIDLSGQVFDRLAIIERAEDYISPQGKHYIQWLCQCECGNLKVIKSIDLRKKRVKSCGCLEKENLKLIQQEKKKYNNFEVLDDIVKVFFNNCKDYFICDKTFWTEEIQQYCWVKAKNGYAVARNFEGKILSFHRLVMAKELKDNLVVDHINGNILDNRKDNLRICQSKDNSKNHSINKNNTSGVLGVYFDNTYNKWFPIIKVNNKKIYLGSYHTIEEATIVRRQAEEKFFGEYCVKKSRDGHYTPQTLDEIIENYNKWKELQTNEQT